MADAITDAMIEAGVAVLMRFPEQTDLKDAVGPIYLAMQAARPPQLPSDDGLIKALEEARETVFDSLYHLRTDERAEMYHRRAETFLAHIDEALSRHKAPLSALQVTEGDKS